MPRPSLLSIGANGVLRWVPQFLKLGGARMRPRLRLLMLSVLVGLVAGLGAIVFYVTTVLVSHFVLADFVGYRPSPRPVGEPVLAWLPESTTPFTPWLLLALPPLGGLISGAIVFFFAPEAEGHGTDAVIEAYHEKDGFIRPRVPIVKILASAITLGTGGSGGREGPIAQIGAGFGSFLAGLMRLRAADRRVLTAAGMGAGIAAIFRAPLAGALFASEVLYWSPEFEAEVIIPAGIASVVSYCTFGSVFGWKPLFSTPDLTFGNPWELGGYFLLVVVMVLLSFAYTHTFYGVNRAFHRLPIPRVLKPALGAGLAAVLALGLYFAFGRDAHVLGVLSYGYGAIQYAISNDMTAGIGILIAISLGKILTTSLTIGSGGSGGVFGPSMVIGGCGGGALGIALHRLSPDLVPHPASFVLVGMAGFFAAAAKTPFSTLVIVSEMTGGYHLLLPALWVCVLAFVLSDRKSIYSSQIESRYSSPLHRGAYVRQLLASVDVGQFLDPKRPAPLLHLADPLGEVIQRLNESRYAVLPVVDDDGRLLGLVTLDDVLVASEMRPLIVAADVMRADVAPLVPDDTLDLAQEAFVDNDLMALPVVNSRDDRRVLGMVKRFDISSTYVKYMHGRPGGPAARSSSDS